MISFSTRCLLCTLLVICEDSNEICILLRHGRCLFLSVYFIFVFFFGGTNEALLWGRSWQVQNFYWLVTWWKNLEAIKNLPTESTMKPMAWLVCECRKNHLKCLPCLSSCCAGLRDVYSWFFPCLWLHIRSLRDLLLCNKIYSKACDLWSTKMCRWNQHWFPFVLSSVQRQIRFHCIQFSLLLSSGTWNGSCLWHPSCVIFIWTNVLFYLKCIIY